MDAYACSLGGLHFVICGENTRRALVDRGLAVREVTCRYVRTVLTPEGVRAAEQIIQEQSDEEVALLDDES